VLRAQVVDNVAPVALVEVNAPLVVELVLVLVAGPVVRAAAVLRAGRIRMLRPAWAAAEWRIRGR
jgi:hypothetical protein